MRCPKCGCDLKPWPWQDGGYKGVECTGTCGESWWSDEFAERAHEAEKAAVAAVMAGMEFPKDAVTDKDYFACLRGETTDG